MDFKNTLYEETALSYLPHHLAEAVRRSGALFRGNISEIRLRQGMSLAVTTRGKSILTPIKCTYEDLLYTVRALCGNSLYSHSETIKEGYICTDGGIRAGVCGRAIIEGARITAVTDINSISIRIPHRIPGAADGICKLVMSDGFRGMIIYSPPGEGKTTALRELTARLGSRPYSMRLAVIDTRFEICGGLGGDLTADVLLGYPRAKGIEIALRTLSPELIICDEVGSMEESTAILEGFGSGVPIIATVHGASLCEVRSKAYINRLIELGVFSHAVGLKKRDGSFELKTDKLLDDDK